VTTDPSRLKVSEFELREKRKIKKNRKNLMVYYTFFYLFRSESFYLIFSNFICLESKLKFAINSTIKLVVKNITIFIIDY
jgi:hypothetical protein